MPRSPPDVLTSLHHWVRDAIRPALIITQRFRDDARPTHRSSRLNVVPHPSAPTLQPFKIVMLTSRPLRHMRQLHRGPIRISGLKVDRVLFESRQQLAELVIRY